MKGGAAAYQEKLKESRERWKLNLKNKLRAKGHEITPWLEKHIDYLAELTADEYKAEIAKFKKENPDAS
jgi:hypothetical protein